MNILQKIQDLKIQTAALERSLREIMEDTKFTVSFQVRFEPHTINVFDFSDGDNSVKCILIDGALMPMTNDEVEPDLLDIIDHINKEVSKL